MVLTAAGGITAHVRRSRVLELGPGASDLGVTTRLVALAAGLGWTPRG
jgi:hypothetical protein